LVVTCLSSCSIAMRRQSGTGIVYSAIDVKKWAEQVPSVEAVRPGCCSRCGAASRPPGRPLVLHGHGGRERQVRGPAGPRAEPQIRTVVVRRYRCRLCGGLTTVLPRGLAARRHYSASAIGLALCLYGVRRCSEGQTRLRVCAWRLGFEPHRWTTLASWVASVEQGRLFARVRPCPPTFTARDRAERIAATLCGFAIGSGAVEAQAFEGGALAA
jgi:hypothetical protein